MYIYILNVNIYVNIKDYLFKYIYLVCYVKFCFYCLTCSTISNLNLADLSDADLDFLHTDTPINNRRKSL